MKTIATKRMLLALLSIGLFPACAAGPQDPVKVDPTHYTVLVENEAVRILKIGYGPGEKSVMHHHPDAIVVALGNSKTRFSLPDGTTRESELMANSAQYTPEESHNPENIGGTRSDAILVEFKTPAPGTAMLPATREGLGMGILAEGPRAAAFRTMALPTFEEPEGTTHDYDQVVIALGPAEVPLTIDGKLVRSSWARGDVQFIGRGVPHSSKNMTGSPVDYILVAIK